MPLTGNREKTRSRIDGSEAVIVQQVAPRRREQRREPQDRPGGDRRGDPGTKGRHVPPVPEAARAPGAARGGLSRHGETGRGVTGCWTRMRAEVSQPK